MSQKNSFNFIFSGLILVLLVAACAPAPGVAPTQPQPLSTSNPDAFSTIVAGTAAVAMAQTLEAMPTVTATLSPPTETQPPTITATPTDANESTSLTDMEDGTTQFFDYQAGIKLSFPVGWMAVRLSEQEFMDAWVSAIDDPVLQHDMESVQALDPITHRVHAFNTQAGYVSEGQGSAIAILFAQGDTRELEKVVEDELQPKEFDGYRLISPKYQVRPDGVEFFAMDESWQVLSSTAQQVMLYHKRVIFKVSTGTVSMDLYTPLEIKDIALSEFDALIQQFSIFEP